MKPTINQGDGPKIALLIVGLVVALGLVMRTVLTRQASATQPTVAASTAGVAGSSSSTPAAPPATTPAPAAPGAGQVASAAGTTSPDLWAQVDKAGESLPAGFRDPFKAPPSQPKLDPSQQQWKPGGTPPPSVQVSAAHPTTKPAPTLPTFTTQPTWPSAPVAPVQVTPPDMLLKGVVAGSPPVAVIKVGDRTMQAEPGIRLPDGSMVARIDADGIILQRGAKRARLDVGSSQLVEIAMVRATAQARPSAPPPGPAVLVRDGQPVSGIIIAADAPDAVVYAAGRLRSYIEQVTGAALPILDHPGKGLAIYVGPSRFTKEHGLRLRGLRQGGFRIVCRSDYVAIYGRDQAGTHIPGAADPWQTVDDQAGRDLVAQSGTLQAVYRFLETSCGVRWNVGSDAGPTIPTLATISVANQRITLPHGLGDRYAAIMVRDRFPSASVAVIRAAIARNIYRRVAGQV